MLQLFQESPGLEEMSEVPDASCSPQSSTIIFCFLSGTHSYIDGTKDWEDDEEMSEAPDASCSP